MQSSIKIVTAFIFLLFISFKSVASITCLKSGLVEKTISPLIKDVVILSLTKDMGRPRTYFDRLNMTTSGYLNRTISLVGDTSEKAVKKAANKQAHRAAVMSAILPGLGQAYNKKFWKIPIVYAALAAGSYLLYYENNQYQNYHNELLYRYHHNLLPSDPNSNMGKLSVDNLNTEKLVYEKYRDFSIVGVVIIYALNVIDASVDGHFKTFDVSDNLSMTIKPKTFFCAQNPFNVGAGLSLSLTFK